MRFQGRSLTWCNGQEGRSRKWAWLDRAVMNIAFANTFGSSYLEYLHRKSSDHSPMMLFFDVLRASYGPSPFKFQNMWCSHSSFLPCVEDIWKQLKPRSGLVRLATKLKKMKVALQSWNVQVFGRVDQSIKSLEERLEVLEHRLQVECTPEVVEQFFITKMELVEWQNREETRLAQRQRKNGYKRGSKHQIFSCNCQSKT
ncbi:hypothetical protein F2P56_012635 [Juglans regia]|uniref:Uncharacterized protein n=1 Tax=Juglans regia TaxID=51240 RepID=A0A833XK82_JUGRE|nr:hypothetical protein F2P56_012635 [Juglans regia]